MQRAKHGYRGEQVLSAYDRGGARHRRRYLREGDERRDIQLHQEQPGVGSDDLGIRR